MRRTLLHVAAMIGMLLVLAGTCSAYYDPTSGRFLSPDPLGHEASMDLYSYANGDPINECDPDGRFGKNSTSPQLSMNWDGSYSDVLKPVIDPLKAQAAIDSGNNPEGWARQQYYAEILRMAVSAVPVVPLFTSYVEAINGRDLFTGERISRGDALLNFGLSAVGTLGMANIGVRSAPLQSSLAPRSAASIELPTFSRGPTVGPTQLEFPFMKDIPVVAPPRVGGVAFRAFGADARGFRPSWSPQNPLSVPNYAEGVGLPSRKGFLGYSGGAYNSGGFVAEGTILDTMGVSVRMGRPLHGRTGGLVPEWAFPLPEQQIRIDRVYGVNPPLNP